MEQYQIGDSVYLISNFRIAKAFITEILTKTSLDGTMVRYTIRPYGMRKSITVEAERLYSTLDESKEVMRALAEKFIEETNTHMEKINEDLFEDAEIALNTQTEEKDTTEE